MISVTIYKKKEDYARLHCIGHAGFAASGSDIVCAAVSALVINTVNSIDRLTSDAFDLDSEESSGEIDCKFVNGLSVQGRLLMDSLTLGLTEIQKTYGNAYMTVTFEEV